VKRLEDDASYDFSNWDAAMDKAQIWGEEIPIGKFFERTDQASLQEMEPVLELGPLVYQSYRIPAEIARTFVEELM
jgi:2-oxoglutarate ferredoxin oxidoreductase subunit beta